MSKKRIIWTNDINVEDWIDEDGNQMSYDDASQLNYEYLEDEKMNLYGVTDGDIVILADLGLWDGRRKAHKYIGHRISNIFLHHEGFDGIVEWYSDGKDIVCYDSHHDGVNHYRYRVVKPGRNIDDLFLKPLTERRIAYYTRSLLPDVAKVYGW